MRFLVKNTPVCRVLRRRSWTDAHNTPSLNIVAIFSVTCQNFSMTWYQNVDHIPEFSSFRIYYSNFKITRGGGIQETVREERHFELPWEFWFADKLLQIFLVQVRREVAVREAAVTKNCLCKCVKLFSLLSHRRPCMLFIARQHRGKKRVAAGVTAVALCGRETEQDLELQWQHEKSQCSAGEVRQSKLSCAMDPNALCEKLSSWHHLQGSWVIKRVSFPILKFSSKWSQVLSMFESGSSVVREISAHDHLDLSQS